DAILALLLKLRRAQERRQIAVGWRATTDCQRRASPLARKDRWSDAIDRGDALAAPAEAARQDKFAPQAAACRDIDEELFAEAGISANLVEEVAFDLCERLQCHRPPRATQQRLD